MGRGAKSKSKSKPREKSQAGRPSRVRGASMAPLWVTEEDDESGDFSRYAANRAARAQSAAEFATGDATPRYHANPLV